MKYLMPITACPIIGEILKKPVDSAAPYKLRGYKTADLPIYNKAFVKDDSAEQDCLIIDITSEDLWHLSQWMPATSFEIIQQDDLFFHVLTDSSVPITWKNAEEFICLKEQNSMPLTDIHLMLSGHFLYDESLEKLHTGHNPNAECFIKNLTKYNQEEFSNDFVKILDRSYLNQIFLTDQEGSFVEAAIACFTKHQSTNLGIVDLVALNCCSDCLRIIETFRYGKLYIILHGKKKKLNEWLQEISFVEYGERRNVIFTHKGLPESTIIKALASECDTMGDIIGTDFQDMLANNIAQYNTATVYVSDVTLIEINYTLNPHTPTRLESEAIEVFFVELLMLQDAAISKLTKKINHSLTVERMGTGHSLKTLENLLCEVSQSVMFFNPVNFRFPSVRMASRKISEKFGIHRMEKNYLDAKDILEQLMSVHRLQKDRKENNLLNIFLIILTLIQVLPLIAGAIHFIVFREFDFGEFISEVTACSFLTIISLYIYRQKKRNSPI